MPYIYCEAPRSIIHILKTTIAHTHPYISTSRTTTIHKSTLNTVEIKIHNNNTIPHNLQETNQRKSKANCPQSLSPITINYQKFCCLLGGAAVVEAEGGEEGPFVGLLWVLL